LNLNIIKMKKILFLGLAFSLFACKNNDSTEEQAVETAVQTTTEDLIDSTVTTNTTVEVDNTSTDKNSIMYSNSNSVYNTNPTQTTNTVAPDSVAKGMNPAHGQAGHRCDIAVGAPLNSKPGMNATPSPTSTTISSDGNTGTVISNGAKITTTKVSSPTVTPEGMNPPHGENGHRCDLAVGAPLNSAAVPTVANEKKE
jgi:hypothetical protein